MADGVTGEKATCGCGAVAGMATKARWPDDRHVMTHEDGTVHVCVVVEVPNGEHGFVNRFRIVEDEK